MGTSEGGQEPLPRVCPPLQPLCHPLVPHPCHLRPRPSARGNAQPLVGHSHLLQTHLNMFRTSVLPHTPPPRPAVKEKMGLEKGVWVTGSTEDPFPESAGARASAGTAHLRVIFASPGGREKPQPFLSKTRILLYFCLDSSGKNVPKTSGAAECWRGNVGLVGDLLRAI